MEGVKLILSWGGGVKQEEVLRGGNLMKGRKIKHCLLMNKN